MFQELKQYSQVVVGRIEAIDLINSEATITENYTCRRVKFKLSNSTAFNKFAEVLAYSMAERSAAIIVLDDTSELMLVEQINYVASRAFRGSEAAA